MTPMERLQAITNKFEKAVNPVRPSQPGPNVLSSGPVTMPPSAKAIANNMSTKTLLQGAGSGARPISQTVPGASATKTVINKPGTQGIKAPAVKPSLFGKALRGLSTLSGAIMPIQVGSILGETYAGMDRAPAVSGRGSGRATFNPPKPALDIGQTDQTVSPRKFADIRGSATPGSDIPATTNVGEAEAMASAESSRPGAGYPAGVDKPMDYAPVAGTGGGMTAGTPVPNMTYESYMRDIGTPQGLNLRNPFESTNLPGTVKAESEIPLPKDGETPAGGEVENAVKATEDDSRAVNLDPSESAPVSEGKASRRRASRSFLDGKMGSMQALRAAEAEMGLVSQGGKKFMRKGDELIGISREQYRARMDGGDIEAIFGENPSGAGPVAELSAAPKGYNKVSPSISKDLGGSDAYIAPSDSQNPIIANTDHTPIDGEAQVKMKATQANNFAQSRLRKSFG